MTFFTHSVLPRQSLFQNARYFENTENNACPITKVLRMRHSLKPKFAMCLLYSPEVNVSLLEDTALWLDPEEFAVGLPQDVGVLPALDCAVGLEGGEVVNSVSELFPEFWKTRISFWSFFLELFCIVGKNIISFIKKSIFLKSLVKLSNTKLYGTINICSL